MTISPITIRRAHLGAGSAADHVKFEYSGNAASSNVQIYGGAGGILVQGNTHGLSMVRR